MQNKLIALIFCFSFCSLFADSPLDPPEIRTYRSPWSGHYAVSIPGENPLTIGYSSDSGAATWKIKKWFRQAWVSHQGECFIAMHNSVNLIPLNSPEDTVLLSFWSKGELKKEYTLNELKELGLEPVRTTSHWSWASEYDLIGIGFRLVDDHDNVFIFREEDGKLIYIGKLNPVY